MALTVAGLVTVAALRATAGALAGGEQAEGATLALLTAESLLAEAGVTTPLDTGTRRGTARGGLRWSVTTELYDGLNSEVQDRLPARPVTVTATVRWTDGPAGTVSLSMIKLRARDRADGG